MAGADEPESPRASTPGRERVLKLVRFSVRALRVTASTIAVVALLKQEWVAAAAFVVAWLLIQQAPKVFPLLQDSEAT
jgi:hypothetical protein